MVDDDDVIWFCWFFVGRRKCYSEYFGWQRILVWLRILGGLLSIFNLWRATVLAVFWIHAIAGCGPRCWMQRLFTRSTARSAFYFGVVRSGVRYKRHGKPWSSQIQGWLYNFGKGFTDNFVTYKTIYKMTIWLIYVGVLFRTSTCLIDIRTKIYLEVLARTVSFANYLRIPKSSLTFLVIERSSEQVANSK